MSFPITSKTALVTGAGSGICFCFATLLISRGCNVLIADLALRPEAQTLVDETAGKTPRAVFVKTDVTEWGSLERAVAEAVKEFGAVDVFCPGAGVFEPKWSSFWYPPGSADSHDTPSSNGYKTLDINLTHPIRLTQLGISHLLARKSPGAIIHISSIAAQKPNPLDPIYCVTKAGVSALVRSLAVMEDKHGIRVAGVAPGLIKTPLFLENADKLSYIDPEKDRWVTPEEVARHMLRLIEEPEMVGGTILEVGLDVTRMVEVLNDPGPAHGGAKGLGASSGQFQMERIAAELAKEGWGVVPPSE